MTFGERIREYRKRKNLTQKDLANLIGAKHNSISNWENNQNKPDPDTIELLCGVLDISPSYLMGYEENTPGELTNLITDINHSKLLSDFDKLNNDGKLEALKRVDELTYIPRYTADKPHLVLNAAHTIEGATEEELQHDEDIMDDENF